LSIKQVMCVIL